MRATTQDLKGFTVKALDQRVGVVEDLHFDDRTWRIHQVVVETGKWLESCQVTVEMDYFKAPHWKARVLPVGLTMNQINNCPAVTMEKPVFLQKENTRSWYYRWPRYWGGTDPLFPASRKMEPVMDYGTTQVSLADWEALTKEQNNPHLRSCHELLGYSIEAEEGIVGSVVDFVIEDTDWAIPYIAVETHHWLEGKIVYFATRRCEKVTIDWSRKCISLDMTQNEIEYSPDHLAPDHLISKVGVKLF
ncbi:hypothetical protein [Candidatus Nitronereus thalassa]|uniref:PRC-barrel domain-containing protein n=1 Tax=Candidatus Nitronereus thalassa TaxID=3020898 RepID=A0ABU3KBF8_9BACT|nr:hypothetical protein [Candidatus Nitronereus thalassa]MDT7043755.1 hypothetical protein [Candidatus Nitronereus thalassa]